jgi:Leucine-rich repeat (LRR) protein
VQFDLAHFPKLKGLSGFWHRKSRGLETLAKLEQLWLLGAGQPFKTVAELGLHPRLRELTITQNRVLTSLAGIEKLTKLEKLELNHMRGIDLAPLGKAKKLKHFEAESLNAFRNLERIASCRTLNYISMTGSGPLKSIRWAARMKWLEGLVLISSPVKDNDFSVIPKLPKLIYFSAPHHAAYRPKIADLEALVEARYEKAGL